MDASIELPLWLVLLAALFALAGLLDRLLVPSARWLLRRRVNQVIDDVNTRLHLRLQPFKLTRRQVLIDRLVHDPEVMRAVDEAAEAAGTPREVQAAAALGYAREIVPAFNAYVYFRIGYRLARLLARTLYRVRVIYPDSRAIAAIPEGASVVFVMNHRSNMDYVLLAYLAANQAALSYAVGEWARIWPLQQLIRLMGAFFVRRRSENPLYRRVLRRYVAMATAAGVTQAVFPEGGLSRDGALRPPRVGILRYMLDAAAREDGAEVVFIPVGVNYDRVLEDRSLLGDDSDTASEAGAREMIRATFAFLLRQVVLAGTGRWHRFGYACVVFGEPLTLSDWRAGAGLELDDPETAVRLADTLMARVARALPVTPVALVADVLQAAGPDGLARDALAVAVDTRIAEITAAGGYVHLPRSSRGYLIEVGLRMLLSRRLVHADNGRLAVVTGEEAVVAYYANAVRTWR